MLHHWNYFFPVHLLQWDFVMQPKPDFNVWLNITSIGLNRSLWQLLSLRNMTMPSISVIFFIDNFVVLINPMGICVIASIHSFVFTVDCNVLYRIVFSNVFRNPPHIIFTMADNYRYFYLAHFFNNSRWYFHKSKSGSNDTLSCVTSHWYITVEETNYIEEFWLSDHHSSIKVRT